MEISTIFEQFLLSCFLFVVFFCVVSLLFYVPKSQPQTDLDLFYDRVSQDPFLEQKLEAIVKQENVLEQIVELGVSLGYSFTVSQLKDSMAIYTPPQPTQYFCLPIGCWQKA